MPITVSCPTCGKHLTAPDAAGGKVAKCPSCSAKMTLPEAEASSPAADEWTATPAPEQNPPKFARLIVEDYAPTQPSADGSQPRMKFCQECGERIRAKAEICPKCGVRQPYVRDYDPGDSSEPSRSSSSDRTTAGILAILVGCFGVHKFYLGLTGPGVVLLVTTLVSCVLALCYIGLLGLMATCTVSLIEGIIYLTKTDAEFHREYVVRQRQWF